MISQAVPVSVERNRKKTLLSILGCIPLGLASAAIAAGGSISAVVVGAVGVVIFIRAVAPLALGLTRRGPGLIIDDDGFDDRSTPLSAGRVSWTDVLTVYPLPVHKHWVIVIEFRHPHTDLARHSWLFRISARATLALVGPPLSLTLTAGNLKTDTESLFALLHESFERHRRRGYTPDAPS
jgi:hypothetical protein